MTSPSPRRFALQKQINVANRQSYQKSPADTGLYSTRVLLKYPYLQILDPLNQENKPVVSIFGSKSRIIIAHSSSYD